MKELVGLIAILLICCICGFFGMIILDQHSPQKIFKTRQKATIDYELEAKGKVIDTIWIYKIK